MYSIRTLTELNHLYICKLTFRLCHTLRAFSYDEPSWGNYDFSMFVLVIKFAKSLHYFS